MSAFDDEFGLFGDDASEEERRSTLGARRIASDEAAHDDVEPEDERPRRGRRERAAPAPGEGEKPRRRERFESRERGARKTADPAVAQQRALDLLAFLARKLVTHSDEVLVETVDTERGPVVELVVVHDDLGKVIGRSGRVAHALRTLVRATAETRISVDIVSYEEDDAEEGAEQTAGTQEQSSGEPEAAADEHERDDGSGA
ncbi:MAG: KH domain-containing protein [Candidatus Eremiobacteraeota bacterium]|nr:KH domain-containing protein [Candidatus Eremiobacteraeota bacterium]